MNNFGCCPYVNSSIGKLCVLKTYIDDLVQDCDISSALAMEMPQFCTKPSICSWVLKWQNDSVSSLSPTYVGLVDELYKIFFVAIMVIWSCTISL